MEGRFAISPEDEEETSNPEEEGTDDLLLRPPEAQLPLPAADEVAKWWHQSRQRFSAGIRYLEGRPCSPDELMRLLAQGPLRRHSALALELRIRSQGACNLPLGAFMDAQQQELEQARARVRLSMDSFSRLVRRGPPPPVPSTPAPAPRLQRAPPSAETPVITAMGMVSPLALGVVASCAAARAGLLQATELEGCEALDPVDEAHHPVRGHVIPQLTQGFVGLGRLASLGAAALSELRDLKGTGARARTGLYVALPSEALAEAHAKLLAREEPEDEDEEPTPPADRQRPGAREFLLLLVRLAGLSIPRDEQRAFRRDAPGFLQAIEEGLRALRERRLDRCIVGGIDSLAEPSRLQALKALGLIKTPTQPARMMPGEAAAFLVLERHRDALQRGARALATCEGINLQLNPSGRWEGAAKTGRMLAESLASTLGGARARSQLPGCLIGSLNGHDRRAYAWGHALPILGSQLPIGQLPSWSPAESFGELGAATGPVAVCMAVRDFARGAKVAPDALVWLMGDDGSVGSFQVTTALRERLPSGGRA